MIKISSQIVQRLSELGFEVKNDSMHNATAYFIRKDIISILGKDVYDENNIDIVLFDKGLSISPNDADRFTITVENGKLIGRGKDVLFLIYKDLDKIVNINHSDNVDYQSVASEKEFALMKYVNNELVYDVRAEGIGAIKSGKHIYQLEQKYPNVPKEESSFLYKLQNVIANNDIVSVDMDIDNVAFDAYDAIFNKLNEKYANVINDDVKTR